MDRDNHLETQRHTLRSELCHAAKILGEMGCLPATDGNFSARLDAHRILLTSRGVEKRTLGDDGFVEVALDGQPALNVSTEWAVHRAIYQKRKEVHCILHVHSPALTTFAVAHRLPRIELLAEAYMAVGRITLVPFAAPGTPALGSELIKCDESAMVYLLANHGAVAVGGSVLDTLHRLERAEFLARVEITASAIGGGVQLTPDQLAQLS